MTADALNRGLQSPSYKGGKNHRHRAWVGVTKPSHTPRNREERREQAKQLNRKQTKEVQA